MKDAASNLVTAILAACALAVSSAAVKRTFFAPPEPGGVVEVKNWRELAATGNRMGPADAPVVIVEFSDFECPFCKQAADLLKEVRRTYPGKVAVVYRHFPLGGHRYADRAALATECAAEQGAFEAYHDALFERPDSIGVTGWDRYAERAAVPDLPRFRECVESGRLFPRVEADLREGRKLGFNGTPMFIVNGRSFVGSIPEGGWNSWVERALREAREGRRAP
ncbi:MAG TPA: thioredoxin domain-containing protein [Longimicrobium sp.]|nr:thioredoxin domain-containing protein [Longimicrobium sp.]